VLNDSPDLDEPRFVVDSVFSHESEESILGFGDAIPLGSTEHEVV
jgi:hypothetical protein